MALLKSTARMPESILVDKKDETKPSHHDSPLRFLKCASYALKWMDEGNDHHLGEPSHLTNYSRVHMSVGAFYRIGTFHHISTFTDLGTFTRLGTFTCLGTIYHHLGTRLIYVQQPTYVSLICMWRYMVEVGYSAVRQEVLYGSHRLCPDVQPIRMFSFLEYSAKNEDACALVGLWAPQRS